MDTITSATHVGNLLPSSLTNSGKAEPTEFPADKFPPVVFDMTLYDLLKVEADIDGEPVETLCQFKPNSDEQYGPAVPWSTKFIIHCGQVDREIDLAHIQLEVCSYLLMFFAGPMNVIFMGAEGKIDDPYMTQKSVHYMARYNFGAVQEGQRSTIKTYKDVDDLIQNHDGSKIRWAFGMDIAEKLPCVIPPETTYLINSKRWLATCPLPSANDRIIDCEIKCPDHTINGLWYYGGKSCETCTEGVHQEVRRILNLLESTPAPYVLKMSQSLSAVGTTIVSKEEKKKSMLETMDSYLSNYLPRITKDNAHLLTTTLLTSDFIQGETTAINLFVKKDGSVIPLGVCTQVATGQSGRQSSAIVYPDQEKLLPKFQKTFDHIGKVLHDECGYWGPVGADVMVDPDNGTQYVIDLNVRMALSITLYGLQTHYWKNHGLSTVMAIECIMMTISREEFEKKFEKEFKEARIVVMGSTRMGEKNEWAFGILVAGNTMDELNDLQSRFEEYETGHQADV